MLSMGLAATWSCPFRSTRRMPRSLLSMPPATVGREPRFRRRSLMRSPVHYWEARHRLQRLSAQTTGCGRSRTSRRTRWSRDGHQCLANRRLRIRRPRFGIRAPRRWLHPSPSTDRADARHPARVSRPQCCDRPRHVRNARRSDGWHRRQPARWFERFFSARHGPRSWSNARCERATIRRALCSTPPGHMGEHVKPTTLALSSRAPVQVAVSCLCELIHGALEPLAPFDSTSPCADLRDSWLRYAGAAIVTNAIQTPSATMTTDSPIAITLPTSELRRSPRIRLSFAKTNKKPRTIGSTKALKASTWSVTLNQRKTGDENDCRRHHEHRRVESVEFLGVSGGVVEGARPAKRLAEGPCGRKRDDEARRAWMRRVARRRRRRRRTCRRAASAHGCAE